MRKRGKRYKNLESKIDKKKEYSLEDAIALSKSLASAKFDETVVMAVRLGVKPQQADQMGGGAWSCRRGLERRQRYWFLQRGRRKKKHWRQGQILLVQRI